MALVDDYAFIAFMARKGVSVLAASTVNTVKLNPELDVEGETQITVTPGQKATILAQLATINTLIKNRAAGLLP